MPPVGLRFRITLSPDVTDADGLPAPKMTYRLSKESRAILDYGMDRSEDILRAAGAHTIHRSPLKAQAGFHLMGTARMGDDPETSVVDAHGRCHGSDNLYVIDASVFVTASTVNPMLTAQALAARAVDAMLRE
jgi:choline dehydrogenase-like flavoprotein